MEGTIWAIVPPILAIIMVLITKRVLLSLGVGIVVSALFLAEFKIGDSFKFVFESFKVSFIEGGALNTWNVFIILFILALGILTAFMTILGGTKAFGDWMIKRVKTRKGAQFMPMLLGIVIFIDDYFNSLTVGPISQPITDRHRVSRSKLAYIVDSTAAPISVIAPISSWGAYIIGIIGAVLVSVNVTAYSELEAFLLTIPLNFYVWAALGTIVVIILTKADFGPMRKHEKLAIETGELGKVDQKEEEEIIVSDRGKVRDLILPIITLVVTTLALMYITGYRALEEDRTLMNILGEADVALSLLLGGLAAILVVFILFAVQKSAGALKTISFAKGIALGFKSMISAVFILLFAWAISHLIDLLETGTYLGDVIASANLNVMFLPVIMFILAGFIAFSTGTSWGSFAILIPIAGQIASATEIELLIPSIAAVLAGAVFGDHCSPISDTTILSSTGAGCNHIDHVTTQLPYALTSAVIAAVGYIVLGVTNSTLLGLGFIVLGLVVLYIYLKNVSKTPTKA